MAFLEIHDAGSARRVDLPQGSLTIGRSSSCGLVIPSDATSRQHARLEARDSRHVLEDLGSRNGTRVNGRQIGAPVTLADGDEIAIGPARMRYFAGASQSGTSMGVRLRDDTGDRMMILETVDAEAAPIAESGAGKRLQLVLEINHELTGTLDLDEVLRRILGKLFTIFPQADWGVLLLRGDSGQLEPRIVRHRGDRAIQSVEVSRTIAAHVMEQREAVLIGDAGSDSQFATAESVMQARIRSVMCVPLVAPEQPLGVLQLHCNRVGLRFSAEDLALLAAVAAASTAAIENARMRERLLAQERLSRDLEVARSVQLSLLPNSSPVVPGYAFFHRYVPAERVGGDYFGFVRAPCACLGIAIGDVSGKGLPAALWMARLSSDIRHALHTEPDPGKALASLHRELEQAMPDDRFVTMILAILDPAAHTLQIANAGHIPALVRRADGRIEPVGQHGAGMPLGVDPNLDLVYRVERTTLQPGEFVLLTTDGVTEARDPGGSFYGDERLRRIIALAPATAEGIGEAVCRDVDRFSAGGKQRDDLTLVCFGRPPE